MRLLFSVALILYAACISATPALITEAEEGIAQSQFRLGQAYKKGRANFSLDADKASYWLAQAAHQGLVEAMLSLADGYLNGPWCLNVTKAKYWLTQAANLGNMEAMLILAKLSSGQQAINWYRQAEHLGSQEAEYQKALLLAQGFEGLRGYKESLSTLMKAYNDGDKELGLVLGDYYFTGKIGSINYPEAFKFYLAAASIGCHEAQFKAGSMLYYGQGVAADVNKAIKYLEIAASGEHHNAALFLAHIYRYGKKVPISMHKAAKWYLQAAEAGITVAFVPIAEHYHSGRGIGRYLEQAAYWYNKAAPSSSYANLMLSELYAYGRGVELNHTKAVHYYQKAQQGRDFSASAYKVAMNYQYGFGFNSDLEAAKKWLQVAASANYPLAQLQLAEIYYHANELEQAFTHYTKASNSLNYALYMQGIMYFYGQGTPKQPLKGLSLIRQAANRGVKVAQYQLGNLYLQGQVLPKDELKAYSWLMLALEGDTNELSEEITALFSKFSPELRARAIAQLDRAYTR